MDCADTPPCGIPPARKTPHRGYEGHAICRQKIHEPGTLGQSSAPLKAGRSAVRPSHKTKTHSGFTQARVPDPNSEQHDQKHAKRNQGTAANACRHQMAGEQPHPGRSREGLPDFPSHPRQRRIRLCARPTGTVRRCPQPGRMDQARGLRKIHHHTLTAMS